MANSTLLENITPDELEARIEKAVNKAIAKIAPTTEQDAFITREEAGKRLHLSLVTIDKNIHEGRLQAYRIGGRVLLKESDLKLNQIPVRKHK